MSADQSALEREDVDESLVERLRRRIDVLENQNIELELNGQALDSQIVGMRLTEARLRATNEELEAVSLEAQTLRDEYVSLYQRAPESYLALDRHGAIRRTNLAATLLLGHPSTYLRGTRLVEYLAIEDRERFETYLMSAAGNGIKLEMEATLLSPTDEGKAVRLFTTVVREPSSGALSFQVIVTDIRRQRKAERSLEQARDYLARLAHHDALTGLPNRTMFFDRLRSSMARCRRPEQKVAVLFFDLDGFKPINDSLGHAAGDQLLCEVANRVRARVSGADTVARLGGDEFTVVLEVSSGIESIRREAARIAAVLREPITLGENEVRVSSSIGISVYPEHGETAEELVLGADMAMYRSKEQGRDRVTMYSRELIERRSRLCALETTLPKALEEGQFELHYQPIYRTASLAMSHVEALTRWNHPTLGRVSPDEFIPVIERSGRMIDFGRWLLDEAASQAARWRARGIELPVAVNVSARQLADPDFAVVLARTLATHDLSADSLELELTESELMCDRSACSAMLREVRDTGVRIAIDDFGTGHSSLSRLIDLPIARLKIDRTFIGDLGRSRDADTLVRTIIGMAHQLCMEVVAEGVETQAQLDFLVRSGSDTVQGFLLSRPMTLTALDEMLADGRMPGGAVHAANDDHRPDLEGDSPAPHPLAS